MAIVEHRPISEKHRDERRRLNTEFVGRLTAQVLPEYIVKVASKVGPPPAWFNVEGTTLAQVGVVGAAAKMRRSS